MIKRAGFFAVACLLTGATGVEAGCKKVSYHGWNTDFVWTYNTQDGVESPGDFWSWHANVTTVEDKTDKVGDITGFATRVPAGFWESLETIMFPEGHIFCHYVQKPPATSSTSGITGGTGDYLEASGQIVFTSPPGGANGPWGIDMQVCTPSETSTSGAGQVKVMMSLALFATAALVWS